MAISHQLVPPGGWKFNEERTKTDIIAMNWDDLVKSVKNHRRSNGLPDNHDLELEIESQIAKKHPQLVV